MALNRVIGTDPSVILGTLNSNGKVFMILMLGNAEDRDALYEALFIPAIDAFQPNT